MEDEGNLVITIVEVDNDGLFEWIRDGKYLSHGIINEICQIISLSILRDLLQVKIFLLNRDIL